MSFVKNINGDLTRDDLTTIKKLYGGEKKEKPPKDENIFYVGARVKISEDYDDRLNDIYLEKTPFFIACTHIYTTNLGIW